MITVKKDKLFICAAALVLLVYAIQIPGPLRVNQDAANLLDLASRLTDHQPLLLNGAKSVFPIGMPFVFSMMERLGIANSAGFNILNVVCIVIAAIASASIFQSLRLPERWRREAMILAFSSFILLKHAEIPLTDVPYMAVSLAALAMLESAEHSNGRQKLLRFGGAVCLVIIAILVRRVGIALIPACVYVWCSSVRSRDIMNSRFAIIIIMMSLLFASLAIPLVRHFAYLSDFWPSIQGRRPIQLAGQVLNLRSIDMGEVLLNVPYAKLQRLHGLVRLAGIAMIVLLAAGLWRARHDLRPAHVYFVTYVLILFVWPYGDNRFWLPVLPLMAGIGLQGIAPMLDRQAVHWTACAYTAVYMAMFLIAAVYTTRITFSKDFPRDFADGKRYHEYVEAWSNGAVDIQSARMIRRYGMPRK